VRSRLKAIPATSSAELTVEQSANVLSRHSGIVVNQNTPDYEVCRRAFRAARAKTHPDAGGAASEFTVVNAAGARLAAHFGKPL
jgi:hypothetical protein